MTIVNEFIKSLLFPSFFCLFVCEDIPKKVSPLASRRTALRGTKQYIKIVMKKIFLDFDSNLPFVTEQGVFKCFSFLFPLFDLFRKKVLRKKLKKIFFLYLIVICPLFRNRGSLKFFSRF